VRTAGSVGLIIAAALSACSCSRTRYVTEKVQWSGEQKPYPHRPLPVGAVRFNFASGPDQYFVVTDVPWLLDRLRASGATAATAEFDVYCTWRGKVAGFGIRTVNGNAIPGQAGGWSARAGSSPTSHDLGPFPSACQ
jgi:hypothetical protein